LLTGLLALAVTPAAGCGDDDDDDDGCDGDEGVACTTSGSPSGSTSGTVQSCGPVTASPGSDASDARTPELGDDVCVVKTSTVKMSDALKAADAKVGPTIEAKFEIGDDGNLALSIYPAGEGLDVDAERNVFQEIAGNPTASPWTPGPPEVFEDEEHLKRSARDLTLVQLSDKKLVDVVAAAEKDGFVFWAIPTIEKSRAGYGVYTLRADDSTAYTFVDGAGSSEGGLEDLGDGPGAEATDERAPEIPDLALLADAELTMADAIAESGKEIIEAKFEPNEAGVLSLSLYPVDDIALDSERTTFKELFGEATSASWAPEESVFTDTEHLTRSSRDLTLVQTSGLSLSAAIEKVQEEVPAGFIYWAIPTRRGTRAGYGIYTYDAGSVRYFFVS
jgi:hypothetical protein